MQHLESQSLSNPQLDARHLKRSLILAAGFTGALWLIKIIEATLDINFARFGIFPGQINSLAGIALAPLIHSSFSHLLANTAPLLILGTALLYGYPRSSRIVIPAVYLGSGLAVWLFARPAYHIGASGLTFGFMFFVFAIGALRWDRRAIALSMIVFFLYGGMVWGIFPQTPTISFESHLFGAIIGVGLAILLKNHDPYAPEKKYSWEDDEAIDGSFDDDPPDTRGR